MIDNWQLMRPVADPRAILGAIPSYLSLLDKRGANRQFATHPGNKKGWSPRPIWRSGSHFRLEQKFTQEVHYPCLGTQLREDTVMVYENGLVGIFWKGGFEAAVVSL